MKEISLDVYRTHLSREPEWQFAQTSLYNYPACYWFTFSVIQRDHNVFVALSGDIILGKFAILKEAQDHCVRFGRGALYGADLLFVVKELVYQMEHESTTDTNDTDYLIRCEKVERGFQLIRAIEGKEKKS